MNDKKMNIDAKMSQAQVESLIEKYFDCTATEDEEVLLRKALASCPYRSEAIDEAWATMGYFAVGAEVAARKERHAWKTLMWRVGTVAATVAILATVTLGLYFSHVDSENCVAYVNGKQSNDREEIMALIHSDLNKMNEASEGLNDNMMQQLNVMGDVAND